MLDGLPVEDVGRLCLFWQMCSTIGLPSKPWSGHLSKVEITWLKIVAGILEEYRWLQAYNFAKHKVKDFWSGSGWTVCRLLLRIWSELSRTMLWKEYRSIKIWTWSVRSKRIEKITQKLHWSPEISSKPSIGWSISSWQLFWRPLVSNESSAGGLAFCAPAVVQVNGKRS